MAFATSACGLHQHGFRQGLSCETLLITVMYEWASVLNIHGQVDTVFLDFAKAFDPAPHKRLLIKADYYGIRNKANKWLQSFLTGCSLPRHKIKEQKKEFIITRQRRCLYGLQLVTSNLSCTHSLFVVPLS